MKIIKETFFYYYYRRPGRTSFESYAASFESYAAFSFPPLSYFCSRGEPGTICVACASAGQMVDYDVPDMDTAKHLAEAYMLASMLMENDAAGCIAQSESADNFYIMTGKKFAAAIIYKRPISTQHLGGAAGNWYVYRPRGQRLIAEASQRYGPFRSRGLAFDAWTKVIGEA